MGTVSIKLLNHFVPWANVTVSRGATRVLGHVEPETKVSAARSNVVNKGVLWVHNPECS